MWDHSSYKEPINTGQMCFVEMLEDIIEMIFEFIGAKTLFWLSDWKATMYASHTHFKYNEHEKAVQRFPMRIHLLSVFHKTDIKQTKVYSLTRIYTAKNTE